MQDIAERYIELGLRLGKHADELVDSFYGPAELGSGSRRRSCAIRQR